MGDSISRESCCFQGVSGIALVESKSLKSLKRVYSGRFYQAVHEVLRSEDVRRGFHIDQQR